MKMKKILALALSLMLIAAAMSVPVFAAEESEFDYEFIGIGSEGVAYDDLTLPQTTSDGKPITWSTTTPDIITISEDNTTAKIIKQKADDMLNANVVGTVDEVQNTIDFKVGYLWGEKDSAIVDDSFETYDSSLISIRKSSCTVSVNADGQLQATRDTSTTEKIDFGYKFGGNTYTGRYLVNLDFTYGGEATFYIRLHHGTSATTTNGPVNLAVYTDGTIGVHSGDDFAIVSPTSGKITFNLKILADTATETFSVFVNDNLCLKEHAFTNPTVENGSKFGHIRFYANSTSVQNLYVDNIKLIPVDDSFSGLSASDINANSDATVASDALTLPAANAAEDPVAWSSSDGSFAIENNTATGKTSYLEDKTGSLTATVSGSDGVTYIKDYTFTIPKIEFASETTASLDGTLAKGNPLTATITGLTTTSDRLSVVLAIYNGNNLCDIVADVASVEADGSLSVKIDSLGDNVTESSTVKMLVLDSINTISPLTKVTVQK